jgi:uncharacterized membrane protein SpoIIM required for sporulation
VAEAAAAAGLTFYFLLTTLGPPALLLFFDSAATVAFLVETFLAFSSRDFNTFVEPCVPHGVSPILQIHDSNRAYHQQSHAPPP